MVAGKYVVNQSEQAIGSDAAQVCFDIPLPKFKIGSQFIISILVVTR